MNIIIISRDRLWVDSLCITLDLLLECEITCFTQVTVRAESALLEVGANAILLMDSAIPGVDYWGLSDWLNINFEGKSIIFTSSHSYNIHGARMMRHGCFAVICKTGGFSACWRAIQSARSGQNYFIDEESSPFSSLTKKEQGFAQELLQFDVSRLTELKGVSQQAINKKKLQLYKKLNIKSVPTDKTFRLLARLFDF